MAPDQRIRELCAQLLRAQHPAVVQTVAEQLKAAIDDYTLIARSNLLVIEPPSPAPETSRNLPEAPHLDQKLKIAV